MEKKLTYSEKTLKKEKALDKDSRGRLKDKYKNNSRNHRRKLCNIRKKN